MFYTLAVIRFRDINADDEQDLRPLVRWSNDLTIRHLFQKFDSEEQSQNRLKLDLTLMQSLLKKSAARGKHLQLIEWNGQVVGEVSWELDMEHMHDPSPNSAWLGIVIGEHHARGQGLGRKAMLHLETLAKGGGAQQAEIGVFVFNERAQRLYRSMGYQQLTIVPEFTWWKGKRWSDIRMGKRL